MLKACARVIPVMKKIAWCIAQAWNQDMHTKLLLEYFMGRGQLGCLDHRWEDDIKKDFRKTGHKVMNWIELDAQMYTLIYC